MAVPKAIPFGWIVVLLEAGTGSPSQLVRCLPDFLAIKAKSS
ncbi:MAG: hypothetical protein JWM21_1594 [Acidobacteria bacterium]|nr:hypothetical protein [Acidobacteriota bacterium]